MKGKEMTGWAIVDKKGVPLFYKVLTPAGNYSVASIYKSKRTLVKLERANLSREYWLIENHNPKRRIAKITYTIDDGRKGKAKSKAKYPRGAAASKLRKDAYALRRLGLSYAAIGRKISRSGSRVKQMIDREQRARDRAAAGVPPCIGD